MAKAKVSAEEEAKIKEAKIKEALDKSLLERQEKAASKKRGKGITLLVMEGDGRDHFVLVASENQALRTPEDVRAWMVEHDYIGTVYPVRIGKPITRGKQEVIKFT